MAAKKVSLKLLIDTKSQRVLFAEAGKDFVDFLFSILTLPIGTLIRQLSDTGMSWSLDNLYNSVSNLNDTYMGSNQNKNTLLNPKAYVGANVTHLLPDVPSPTTRKLYGCPNNYSSSCFKFIAEEQNVVCPSCKGILSEEMTYAAPPDGTQLDVAASDHETGGYVKGVVTYMIMDDLVVNPMSLISGISLLSTFNVKDFGALKEQVTDMGMNEAVELLRASLISKTVLTDVFLGTKKAAEGMNLEFDIPI